MEQTDDMFRKDTLTQCKAVSKILRDAAEVVPATTLLGVKRRMEHYYMVCSLSLY